METMLDSLLAPPFAADPPVKMNVPAKTLGLILAILGAIGTLFGVRVLFAFLDFSAALVSFGGIFPVAATGLAMIVGLIGTAIGTWGAYQMYQGKHEGRSSPSTASSSMSSAASSLRSEAPAGCSAGRSCCSARSSASSSTTSS